MTTDIYFSEGVQNLQPPYKSYNQTVCTAAAAAVAVFVLTLILEGISE